MCLFIVDEISTLDTPTIAMIDKRLKQLRNSELAFGGIAMMFVGDFNQLGPVKKVFIPKDMIEWAAHQIRRQAHNNNTRRSAPASSPLRQPEGQSNHPIKKNLQQVAESIKKHGLGSSREKKKDAITACTRYTLKGLVHRGCQLVETAERVHLTKQQRSDDEDHSALVKKLSDGNSIDLDDIKRYKPLTKEDIEQYPSDWEFAPVLVSTNRERLDIIQRQCVNYAKKNNTYVIKWRSKQSTWVNKPGPSDVADVERENACFWEFFVKGANGFLNFNVNGMLGLVNGASVQYHSLAFSDPDIIKQIEDAMTRFPVGSEIILDDPPKAINVVILPALDGKTPSVMREKQLKVLQSKSIVSQQDGVIIIPILQCGSGYESKDKFYLRTGAFPHPVASVKTTKYFPLDLAFAMTVHKSQGRTLSRVILALSSRPSFHLQMEFPAIFVAMSRVKTSDHIRVLYHEGSFIEQEVSYLTNLKPNKAVALFYSGYEENNGSWDRNRALLNASTYD
jgi:hypothetical protein